MSFPLTPRGAELADALVEALAGRTFGEDFVPVRSWLPRVDLKSLGALHVWVAPRSRAGRGEGGRAWLNRRDDEYVHAIDVTFQQRVPEADREAQDAFVDGKAALVEGVADALARLHLTVNGVTHETQGVAIDPLAALEHLDEMLLFTAVVTARYREVRAVA